MPKLLAKIEVYLADPDNKDASHVHALGDANGNFKDSMFTITVNPYDYKRMDKKENPTSILTLLCHELGHVVSQILKTPAAMSAWKLKTDIQKETGTRDANQVLRMLAIDETAMSAILTEEKEAWDNARMIYPGLDEGMAESAISTYQEAKNKAPDRLMRYVLALLTKLENKPENIQPPIDDM